MKTKIITTVMAILFLASITTTAIIPVKAEPTELTLTFKMTSADIIAGVDALNQWLVDNGMDTFGGTHMPAEAGIPGQTIMSLVHSAPQRGLGDFWLYPYDPYYYFGGEGGNTPLGFVTWTSVVDQDTNVVDWVNDNTYWGWGIPWWHAQDYDTYPAQAFRDELIMAPGSSTDEFNFTIVIDPSQADANGKFRFLFSGDSYRNPPIGGSDTSVFLGFVDLAPLPIPVYVDIKPGGWPNPINVGSKGVFPVAICGTEDFDVMTIDPATVEIYIEGIGEGVCPIRWSYEDVATPYTGTPGGGHALGGDGYLDLVFHFGTQTVVAGLGLAGHVGETIPLIIKGNLNVGLIPIIGQDYVLILKPAKP